MNEVAVSILQDHQDKFQDALRRDPESDIAYDLLKASDNGEILAFTLEVLDLKKPSTIAKEVVEFLNKYRIEHSVSYPTV